MEKYVKVETSFFIYFVNKEGLEWLENTLEPFHLMTHLRKIQFAHAVYDKATGKIVKFREGNELLLLEKFYNVGRPLKSENV